MPIQEPISMAQTPANQTAPVNSGETKPKILKVISILFFIFASFYFLMTFYMLGVVIFEDLLIQSVNGTQPFSKIYPGFGIIPVIFSLVTLLFFFVAFKMKTGSRFSFWLGTGSLIAVPVPFVVLPTGILMTPMRNSTV